MPWMIMRSPVLGAGPLPSWMNLYWRPEGRVTVSPILRAGSVAGTVWLVAVNVRLARTAYATARVNARTGFIVFVAFCIKGNVFKHRTRIAELSERSKFKYLGC